MKAKVRGRKRSDLSDCPEEGEYSSYGRILLTRIHALWVKIYWLVNPSLDWSLQDLKTKLEQWLHTIWIALVYGPAKRRSLMDWLRISSPTPRRASTLAGYCQDGTLLCALAEAAVPGCCPRPDLLNPLNRLENVRLGLQLITKHVCVKSTLTAEEVVRASPAIEMKLFTFLNHVHKAVNDLKSNPPKTVFQPEEEIIPVSVQECFAKGMGLILAVRGRKARFNIFFKNSLTMDIVIEIQGPVSSVTSERITRRSPKRKVPVGRLHEDVRGPFDEDEIVNIPFMYEVLDGQLSVEYIPVETGLHRLSILCHGYHIQGSPYTVNVDDSTGLNLTGRRMVPSPYRKRSASLQATSDFLLPDRRGHAKDRKSMRTSESRVKHKMVRLDPVVTRRVLRYVLMLNGQEVAVDVQRSELLGPALAHLSRTLDKQGSVGQAAKGGVVRRYSLESGQSPMKNILQKRRASAIPCFTSGVDSLLCDLRHGANDDSVDAFSVIQRSLSSPADTTEDSTENGDSILSDKKDEFCDIVKTHQEECPPIPTGSELERRFTDENDMGHLEQAYEKKTVHTTDYLSMQDTAVQNVPDTASFDSEQKCLRSPQVTDNSTLGSSGLPPISLQEKKQLGTSYNSSSVVDIGVLVKKNCTDNREKSQSQSEHTIETHSSIGVQVKKNLTKKEKNCTDNREKSQSQSEHTTETHREKSQSQSEHTIETHSSIGVQVKKNLTRKEKNCTDKREKSQSQSEHTTETHSSIGVLVKKNCTDNREKSQSQSEHTTETHREKSQSQSEHTTETHSSIGVQVKKNCTDNREKSQPQSEHTTETHSSTNGEPSALSDSEGYTHVSSVVIDEKDLNVQEHFVCEKEKCLPQNCTRALEKGNSTRVNNFHATISDARKLFLDVELMNGGNEGIHSLESSGSLCTDISAVSQNIIQSEVKRNEMNPENPSKRSGYTRTSYKCAKLIQLEQISSAANGHTTNENCLNLAVRSQSSPVTVFNSKMEGADQTEFPEQGDNLIPVIETVHRKQIVTTCTEAVRRQNGTLTAPPARDLRHSHVSEEGMVCGRELNSSQESLELDHVVTSSRERQTSSCTVVDDGASGDAALPVRHRVRVWEKSSKTTPPNSPRESENECVDVAKRCGFSESVKTRKQFWERASQEVNGGCIRPSKSLGVVRAPVQAVRRFWEQLPQSRVPQMDGPPPQFPLALLEADGLKDSCFFPEYLTSGDEATPGGRRRSGETASTGTDCLPKNSNRFRGRTDKAVQAGLLDDAKQRTLLCELATKGQPLSSVLMTPNSDVTEDSGIGDPFTFQRGWLSHGEYPRGRQRRHTYPSTGETWSTDNYSPCEFCPSTGRESMASCPASSMGDTEVERGFIDDDIPDYASLILGNYVSFTGLLDSDPSVVRRKHLMNLQSRRDHLLEHTSLINGPDKCEAYGSGMYYGQVGIQNRFQVNTATAGRGSLSVSIQGPDPHNVQDATVTYLGNSMYEVVYQVSEPGYYVIAVKWSEWNIRDSPFICKVTF